MMTDAVHQPRNFTFPKQLFGTKGETNHFSPVGLISGRGLL